MNVNDIVYYVRILPPSELYEIYELVVRMVNDTWFSAMDKHDKHAYIFSYNNIDDIVFTNRADALDKLKLELEKREL